MKKLINRYSFFSFIPLAIIFLVLLGLFFFMCLPQNRSNVKAQNGILDLRGEAEQSKIAPLHGEWDFIYGELLTPDEFYARKAEIISVPNSWDDAGYPLNGCATYRLTVLTGSTEPFTLFLPEIASSYKLWVNGEAVRSAGEVSTEASEGKPLYENALVPVNIKNGTVELVLQISNFNYIFGGIIDTLLLGETGMVQSWFVRTRTFSCIALGCFLMAGFYYLTLYINRRREKPYLIFALLCFLIFARFLFETNGLNEYFQWVPMNMVGIRIYLLLFFSHSIAVCAFSLYTFNFDFLKKYKVILIALFSSLFLISLIMPTTGKVYLYLTSAVTLPLLLFVIIKATRSLVFKENLLYFASMIFMLVVGSSTKLFGLDNTFFMTGILSNIFMVMSHSLVLSRRYTDAFKFVEETNQNLEQLVDERTKSLQTANEAMLATNTAMKELVSNISHDLKTPLAVMSLNLETLSRLTETQSDAEYQRHVRTAYQKNLDLQRLIKNLFEVSRIETGRSFYSPEWISILYILAQIKDKYDTFLEDNNISLEIIVEDDIEISTDPQKMWSVFDNIIYNSARYTENGGNITITVRNAEQTATVIIADTGCGIESEHLTHIFERFYRVSQSRNAKEGESGLGLYIVKSVMEGCGGSVDAESEYGKGMSVILTFPAREYEKVLNPIAN